MDELINTVVNWVRVGQRELIITLNSKIINLNFKEIKSKESEPEQYHSTESLTLDRFSLEEFKYRIEKSIRQLKEMSE